MSDSPRPRRRATLLLGPLLIVAVALVLAGCSKPKASNQAAEQARQAEQSSQTKQAAGKAAATLQSDVKPLSIAVPLALPTLDGVLVSMPSLPRPVAPVKVAGGGTPAVPLNLGISVQTPSANVALGMPSDLGSIIAGAVPIPVPTAIPTPPAVIPTPPAGIPPGATPPAGFGPPAGIPPGATPPAGFGPPTGIPLP